MRPARHRLRIPFAIALAWLLAAATDAGAASLQVAPTSLTLPPERNADGLWLSNSGSAPVQVQLRLFRWTQHDGKDVLEPTRDLVVSPPMQTLAAGQRQLVRLVRTGPADAAAQAAYRVIVDELPAPDAERNGLQFVLRYSIPIFLAPADAGAPALQAHVLTDAGGQAALSIENTGRLHAQLADITHVDAAGSDRVVLPGLVGYVLPGQRMQWSLKAEPARFVGGSFRARVNGEADEQALPLAPAR